MDRITLRVAISVICAAAIGLLLGYATESGLAFCVLMPTLCFLQKRRIHAFLVAFAYYGAASTILISGLRSFFGPGTTLQLALELWGIACFLLALPFGALWSNHPSAAWWRAPLAVLASVPPPLGIIGWANPLTAAGTLFPGTRWFGLLAVLGFAAFSPAHLRTSAAALTISAIVADGVFPGVPEPPADWEAVDTTFGNVGVKSSSMLKQYETAQYIQQRSLESRARVIVFPETVVPRWSEATDLFWGPTLSRLASSGKILLIGAGVDIPATKEYQNVAIIRGAETGAFLQRIPVPIGMWQPWSDEGVPLRVFQPGAITIAEEKVAVLVCYEQFLVWPVLTSFARRPTLLVGMSNNYWSRQTSIPRVQKILFSVWARLFRLPFLSAVNT